MSQSARIRDHFASLTDPRRRKVVYPLINLITIALCAVIAGADDFVSIAEYGRKKRTWLSQFLDLRGGVPSRDRFNAIFAAIKPAEFEECLLSWVTALHEISGGQVVGLCLIRQFERLTVFASTASDRSGATSRNRMWVDPAPRPGRGRPSCADRCGNRGSSSTAASCRASAVLGSSPILGPPQMAVFLNDCRYFQFRN
jgi:DDE_Tnp_1-associated